MCGIAGFIGKGTITQDALQRTLMLMRNRGPDVQKYTTFSHNGTTISLLHSRLSIIDLDERSNQPFTIGEYTIVFNGEIYNYVELRKKLEGEGVSFHTNSDTEVLLQAYIKYGENCVNDCEGMWSFAIYDPKKGSLFLSRDRFAEKPLYYMETADGLFFGSEVKFIKTLSGKALSINEKHILRYLVNGYKSLYKTSETFFADIKEIPFASNMMVDSALSPKIERYWQPKFTPKKMTLEESIAGFKERLLESMKIRLRADVPLAFCLSGGVDSAALVSISSKIFNYDVATFSIIDQDERYNEYDNIKATIDDLKCKHTIIDITPMNFFNRLRALISYHDSPIATISYYIHSFLSESIHKNGYRVVVSGTAADELVTGYYDHFNLHLYEMRNHPEYKKYLKDWQENTGRFVRNPHLQNPELYFGNTDFRDHIYLNNDVFTGFLKKDFQEVFTEVRYNNNLLRNRMLNELFHEAIPVILHEDDLNSMFYSIENRSPYLDSRLFSFAYSIPAEHLIRKGYGKYILREAVKGILNDKVRLDKRKKGFNASIHSLVDLTDKATRDYILSDSPVYDILKKESIREAMNINPMPNSFSKFFFNFINAKMFLELNIKGA